MAFVAENFSKSIFEPIIDRDRNWAITIGMSDRDCRRSIVLYDLKELDQIGVRDEKGQLVDLPDQPEIALSAITVVSVVRQATSAELSENSVSDEVVEFTMHGSPKGKAHSPYVPGCDWEESKAVYRDALIALDEARRKSSPGTKTRILQFN